ncbi:hypothetical protein C173_14625 [Paenibacillus sp. FSL R7-277]|uniref:polysaccharide pyruvyl transferase family protein n=1 Tax=Paenibacillus sp. FSL R7-277 TaxID=1227352 RepID=UPI0003E222E1|nr:polysaccharide pyruvyl transferase family protein [Paenibacillus sp. FSL R7-277]ETT72282.1 hypothetical protein C173_14625 [Paenibacillus sp. FSL R7-277]
MRIGTITFHWATNYGAVLQAYALQRYLIKSGFKTEIINYVPFKVKAREILSNIKRLQINNLKKEYKINKFRNKNLMLSRRKFHSNDQLYKYCNDYDAYVCGSDQVWNEWFLKSSENKPNLSYYLNFVSTSKKRISYATSFGANKLSDENANVVKTELDKFNNIGVRENTGKSIIENLGLNAHLVVDPTLLLDVNEYNELIAHINKKSHYKLFSYVLHKNQDISLKINNYIFGNYFSDKDKIYYNEPIGIPEWLYALKNSEFVLTNSFHGSIFSIVFRRPFLVVPVEGSKMNDRITTLLHSVGLENRIIDEYNESTIDRLMNETIDWEKVDEKVKEMRKGSINFLENSLVQQK